MRISSESSNLIHVSCSPSSAECQVWIVSTTFAIHVTPSKNAEYLHDTIVNSDMWAIASRELIASTVVSTDEGEQLCCFLEGQAAATGFVELRVFCCVGRSMTEDRVCRRVGFVDAPPLQRQSGFLTNRVFWNLLIPESAAVSLANTNNTVRRNLVKLKPDWTKMCLLSYIPRWTQNIQSP